MTKKTKFFAKSLLAILTSAILLNQPVSVKAMDMDANNIATYHLTQETGSTCTLASASMMFRRRAIIDLNENYSDITEKSMKKKGNWTTGLTNSLLYTDSAKGLNMKGSSKCYWSMAKNSYKQNSVLGVKSVKNKLKKDLDTHPEGIVLYLYNVYGVKDSKTKETVTKTKWQHAVLLTGYDGDEFYCVNPGNSKKKVVKLVDVFKSKSGATTTDALLKNSVKIWYISLDKNTATKYEIKYNMNGGKNNSANPTTYVSSKGASLKNPTRTGYKFDGWYTDKALKNKVTSVKKGTKGTVNLYAKWTSVAYTLSFDGNGATGGNTADIKVNQGTKAKMPECGFEKEGYYFLTWVDQKCDVTSYEDTSYVNMIKAGKEVSVSGDKKYYAFWLPIKYSIKFDSNGGMGLMENQVLSYDNSASLNECVFTADNKVFIGWNTEIDGSGTQYTDCEEVMNLTSENDGTITLYAQWEEVEDTIDDLNEEIEEDTVIAETEEMWEEDVPENSDSNEIDEFEEY